MKFSLRQKLNGVVLYQDYKQNPFGWLRALNVAGHIGIDISRGDGDPIGSYVDGHVVFINVDTVVILSEPGKDGVCLEISHGHMRDVQVKVGDYVNMDEVLGVQDSTGPSLMWSEDTRTQWSHEHIGVRLAIRGKTEFKNYKWNYQASSPIPYSIIEADASVDHFRNPNDFSQQVVWLVAANIQRMEGYFEPGENPRYPTGSLSWRNKNPGNLKAPNGLLTNYLMELGAVGVNGGFCVFPTYEAGMAALAQLLTDAAGGLLRSYKAGMTTEDFFKVYAPSNDNNYPELYAANVAAWTGLNGVKAPISDWLLTEIEWLRKYMLVPFLSETGDSQFPETKNLIYYFKLFLNKYLMGR